MLSTISRDREPEGVGTVLHAFAAAMEGALPPDAVSEWLSSLAGRGIGGWPSARNGIFGAIETD